MRKLHVFTLLVSFFMVSCKPVIFKNSEPKHKEALLEFPDFLLGKYIETKDKRDTLTIAKNSFEYKLLNEVQILSANKLELKQYKDYFLINIKGKGYWNVISFTYKKNKIFVYFIVVEKGKEEESIDEIKEIIPVNEILSNTGILDAYLIDPTEKELQELFAKAIFREVIVFKKLK